MARKYRYIDSGDRAIIERMAAKGCAASDMAAAIDVSLATLYRELHKGYTGRKDPQTGREMYSAAQAQATVAKNMKRRGRCAAYQEAVE